MLKSKLKRLTVKHEEKRDLERKIRIQEIEKQKLKKLESEKEKKRLLQQFRSDHSFVETK